MPFAPPRVPLRHLDGSQDENQVDLLMTRQDDGMWVTDVWLFSRGWCRLLTGFDAGMLFLSCCERQLLLMSFCDPCPHMYLLSHGLLLRTDVLVNSTQLNSDSSPMYITRYLVDGRALSSYHCAIRAVCLLRLDPREPDGGRLDLIATSRSPLPSCLFRIRALRRRPFRYS